MKNTNTVARQLTRAGVVSDGRMRVANSANLVEIDRSGDDEAEPAKFAEIKKSSDDEAACVARTPETGMMMIDVKINILCLILKPFVCECSYPLGGRASHVPECGPHWVEVAQVLDIFLVRRYA